MTAIFLVYGLFTIEDPMWWKTPEKVLVKTTAGLGVVEAGFMLFLVILCGRALKSRETAEREGRIQI